MSKGHQSSPEKLSNSPKRHSHSKDSAATAASNSNATTVLQLAQQATSLAAAALAFQPKVI